MGAAKSILMYNDVRLVLDAAIASGGASYELPTHGKAVHWKQRAYHFRTLLREQKIAANVIPGIDITTPYDALELVIVDKTSKVVLIRLTTAKGILRNANGDEVKITPNPEPVSDELSSAALDLLHRHGD